ncbi:MAG: YceI family protein [Acidimicrobiia bacterium]
MAQRTISTVRTHEDRAIPAVGTYEIDSPHTSVEFVARHLMITKVRGRFGEVRGSIVIAEDPEDSRVEAEIRSASLSTGDADRDAHLLGTEFFETPIGTRPSPSARHRREPAPRAPGRSPGT